MARFHEVVAMVTDVPAGERRALYLYDADSVQTQAFTEGVRYVAKFPCPVRMPVLFRILAGPAHLLGDAQGAGRWVLVVTSDDNRATPAILTRCVFPEGF